MKTLNQIIVLITFGIAAVFMSCERLDIKRTMDTKTDTIEINSTAVIAHGTILDIGDDQIVQHGHCWSTMIEPTIDNNKSELGSVNERIEFSSQLNKIIPGIEHYIRTYIYDGTNYVYGNIRSFILSSENIGFETEEDSTSHTVIRLNSNIDNIGSINFDDHGHCWSQTDPPTIENNITSFGQIDTNQAFTSTINNLNFGRYYLRGYLISENGIIYSNTVTFESEITLGSGKPTLIGGTKIIAYGSIKSLSTKPIHEHGHVWSYTQTQPLRVNNEDYKFNSLGSADKLGLFSSEIDNLIPGRTYYIWSYANDGDNSFFGDVETITIPDK